MFEGTGWEAQERTLKNSRVLIDTCSLIFIEERHLDVVWQNFAILYEHTRKPIIVPASVVNELEKHRKKKNSQDPKDQTLARHASMVMDRLIAMRQKGIVQVAGDPEKSFADAEFFSVFYELTQTLNVTLITQDNALAEGVLGIRNNKALKYIKKINVRKVNQHGRLQTFPFDEMLQGKKSASWNGNQRWTRPEGERQGHKFRLCRTVTSIPDTPMPLKSEPQTGTVLHTDTGQVVSLGKVIGTGGEGSVYDIGNGQVAKIYTARRLTRRRYEKIKLMIANPINCPGICWPLHMLYNSYDEFVGYTMIQARGHVLETTLFNRMLLQERFPQWTRRETIDLCITILEKISYLHKRNVLLGDINAKNILIVSPSEVYFVDTDSYQIEDLPCPVGTEDFKAPEIEAGQYNEFLRTFGNENFAIAVLLFKIMLPGKHPYSHQGGSSVTENIRKMDFPYALGEKSNHNAPEGLWRYIWSHMSYKLKEAFYKTFQKGEEHCQETTRYGADEWIEQFKKYRYALPKMAEKDELALALFPDRLKKNDGQYTNRRFNDYSSMGPVYRNSLPESHSYSSWQPPEEKHETGFVKNIIYVAALLIWLVIFFKLIS